MSIPVVDPLDPVIINVSVQINPLPSDLIRKFMIVSAGDTNLTTNTYTTVNRSSYASIFTSTTSNYTYDWLVDFFTQAPQATAYVFETGAIIGGDPTSNIGLLSTLINSGITPVYKYSCPKGFYGNADFNTLVKSFNGITTMTYFSIEITNGVNPATDPNFIPLIGSKAFFPCYGDNIADNIIDGDITGALASGKYDLSSTNPNTMLNYTRLLTVTAPTLNYTLRNSFNNLGINYAGIITGLTTVFNGRYADLIPWDYWYAWDWFELNSVNNLTAAIVNGANNPSARIAYDQNGIDAIKGILNNVAKNGQLNGTVTDFGSGYDFVNGTIIGSGSFAAVPFYTYIAANPTKYAQGIYDGLSGYMLIGRFIRQVIFNVTIN